MAEGEFALTVQHLEAGLQSSSSLGNAAGGDSDVYALLVDVAAVQRDPAALQKQLAPAERAAEVLDHKLNLGIAQRAWGVERTLAGEFAEAQARLQQAMQLFETYPAPWQIARTRFEMGELARAQNKVNEAREHYARALKAFEELHAEPDAQRTRTAMASLTPS